MTEGLALKGLDWPKSKIPRLFNIKPGDRTVVTKSSHYIFWGAKKQYSLAILNSKQNVRIKAAGEIPISFPPSTRFALNESAWSLITLAGTTFNSASQRVRNVIEDREEYISTLACKTCGVSRNQIICAARGYYKYSSQMSKIANYSLLFKPKMHL